MKAVRYALAAMIVLGLAGAPAAAAIAYGLAPAPAAKHACDHGSKAAAAEPAKTHCPHCGGDVCSPACALTCLHNVGLVTLGEQPLFGGAIGVEPGAAAALEGRAFHPPPPPPRV